LLRLEVPEALGPQGQRLTGRIYTQMQASRDVPNFLISDRGHLPHPAADLDERDAVLIVRDQPDADAQTIPRDRWRFTRVLDGRGREVLDGVLANVAGGMRGEFNQRFGQNSKDRPFMMSHLFPFTDLPEADPTTDARGALHHRLDARRSGLKVMYTNTSSEYHRGDASLIHTDPDGK